MGYSELKFRTNWRELVGRLYSALSVVWIFSFPTSINIMLSLVLSLLLIVFLIYKGQVKVDAYHEISASSHVVIAAVAAVLGYCFFKRWSNPDPIVLVHNKILGCSNIFIGAISVAVSIGSFLFLLRLAKLKANNLNVKNQADTTHLNPKNILYLFLVAIISISICSKSSILYPYNDAPDGNCFFTVGKAITSGKVLYRDIFEQKGPYIHFLHSFSTIFSENTFHGVYIIEVVSAFIFLLYIFKSVRLFNKDLSISMIALFSAFVFSQGGFFHGDEIEEFCLPAIALTNYFLLRNLHNSYNITAKEMFVVGVLAGIVFWSKYTICGFFACWYIVVVIHQIRQHRIKDVLKCFVAGLGGVLTATAPVVIYFASNDAFGSLVDCYFYANIHSYNNVNTGLIYALLSIGKNLLNGIWISLRYNLANSILILCGLFWFKKRKEKLIYLFLCGMTFLFTCAAINPQKYYPFLFAAFAAPGLLFIWGYCERAVSSFKYNNIASLAISAVLLLSLSPNVYMLTWSQEDLPQFRFASIIKQSQDRTLLNYDFLDCGYYTASDVIPNCRFFCKLNMDLPEGIETQNYYLTHGLTEFVVSRDKPLDAELAKLYVLRDSFTFYFENDYRTDYLYQRIS